jgi:hypothetical protein
MLGTNNLGSLGLDIQNYLPVWLRMRVDHNIGTFYAGVGYHSVSAGHLQQADCLHLMSRETVVLPGKG